MTTATDDHQQHGAKPRNCDRSLDYALHFFKVKFWYIQPKLLLKPFCSYASRCCGLLCCFRRCCKMARRKWYIEKGSLIVATFFIYVVLYVIFESHLFRLWIYIEVYIHCTVLSGSRQVYNMHKIWASQTLLMCRSSMNVYVCDSLSRHV